MQQLFIELWPSSVRIAQGFAKRPAELSVMSGVRSGSISDRTTRLVTRVLVRMIASGAAGMSLLLMTNIATAKSVARQSAQERTVEALVRRYFVAMDRQDSAQLTAMLVPGAGAVHADGRQTSYADFLRELSATPRDQGPHTVSNVGNFEFAQSGPVMVAAFDSRLSWSYPGKPAILMRFRESWFFRETPTGWRIFWMARVPYMSQPAGSLPTRPAVMTINHPVLGPQNERAVQFVERFFKTYRAGAPDALPEMFLPGAKIVHCDGTETRVRELVASMKDVTTPTGVPERAKPLFDHFDFVQVGDLTLFAFDNHVVHRSDGHPELEHTFRESWLLQETSRGTKALWATYSLYGAITLNLAGAGEGRQQY